jgi:molybdopterin synthase catalytic subunit
MLLELVKPRSIAARIVSHPIEEDREAPPCQYGHGALVEFQGIVRPEENGTPIRGLVYEVYEAMALQVMREKLDQLHQDHDLLGAEVLHRQGPVDAGKAAIRVRIWARHRASAFAACAAFMDQLKQEVPIWKTATY